MSYLTRLSQNATADANNSSSTNIAGGATFIGTPTSTLGVNSVQVSFKADQNCTIFIDQSPGLTTGVGTGATSGTTALTGTNTKFLRDFAIGDQIYVNGETVRIIDNIISDTSLTVSVAFSNTASGLSYQFYPWDITDSYSFNPLSTSFGITTQAINSYERIRVKNISSTLTKVFRLQTVLCPIIEAVPRTLDSEQNLSVSVHDIEDQFTGTHVWQGDFHDLRANPVIRLAGTTFNGTTKDTNFWSETGTAGTGSVAQSAGQVVLNTGASAGTAQYQTVRLARWVSGLENTFRGFLKLGDTGTTGNTRNWGPFDANNGFFFQLTGTTFNVVSRAGGSDTAVAQASWNRNSNFTLDTNFHTYEIRMTYRAVHFYIDGMLVHTLTPSSALFAQTLNLPVTLFNSAGNNVTMTVGAAFISRTGGLDSETQYKNITTAATYNLKYGAGRLIRLVFNNQNQNAGTVTIYDNTSAASPIIATVLMTKNAAVSPQSVEYGVPFNTGLTIVTSAAQDITVVYE